MSGAGTTGEIKVLYFVASFKNFTGSQYSLLSMVSHLPDNVSGKVLFPGHGRAVEGARRLGIDHEVVEAPASLNTFQKGVLDWSPARMATVVVRDILPYTYRLVRLLRREQVDIVHCNDARSVLLIGPAANLLRKPMIWHIRGMNSTADSELLTRWTHRLSSLAITVADALHSEVQPGLPVRTVYNGVQPDVPRVEDERIDELLERRSFDPARTLRLLTASSLVPYKGHHHLFRALHLLFEDRPELRDRVALVVLGEANDEGKQQYRNHLEGLGRELDIDRNVLWLGWQDHAQGWMALADVVVVPTVQDEHLTYRDGTVVHARCAEGLPRVVLEAMATGRAVIASDVAGVREAVIPGKTGLIVPPADPIALRDALQELVDDHRTREAMGSSGAERARRFNLDATVEGTTAVYRELLERAARRRHHRRRADEPSTAARTST